MDLLRQSYKRKIATDIDKSIREFISLNHGSSLDGMKGLINDADYNQIRLDIPRLGLKLPNSDTLLNSAQQARIALPIIAVLHAAKIPYGQDYKPFILLASYRYNYVISGDIDDAISEAYLLANLLVKIANDKFVEDTAIIAYIIHAIDPSVLKKDQIPFLSFLTQVRVKYAFGNITRENAAAKKILDMYEEDHNSFLYFAAVAAIETIKRAPVGCFGDPECHNTRIRGIYNDIIDERIDDFITATKLHMKRIKIPSWKIDKLHRGAVAKQAGILADIINDESLFDNITTWLFSHKLILLIVMIIVLMMIIFFIIVPVVVTKK